LRAKADYKRYGRVLLLRYVQMREKQTKQKQVQFSWDYARESNNGVEQLL
jgi:hypothetical protein